MSTGWSQVNIEGRGWIPASRLCGAFGLHVSDLTSLQRLGVVEKWTKRLDDEAWKVYGIELTGYWRVLDSEGFRAACSVRRLAAQ